MSNKFLELHESLKERQKLNEKINDLRAELNLSELLDKYTVDLRRNDYKVGIIIRRSSRYDIMPLEDIAEIQKVTGTQLCFINDESYRFAWNFVLMS